MGEKISARLHQELASLHYALWLSPVSAGLFEKMGVSILLHDKGQQRGHTHFLKLPVGPTVYSCKSTQNVRDLHVVMLTNFVHFLKVHLFFLLAVPPYSRMSRQFRHVPQFSRRHPGHPRHPLPRLFDMV